MDSFSSERNITAPWNRRSRRTTRALAAIGAGALVLYGARLLINLYGPALPYSMAECPGNSNESPEFLQFLSIVTNAALRHARFRPLVNGTEFYPAELAALAKAERSIDMEFYEWQEGRISNEFLQVLTERARNGVEVRIVVDALGSFKTRRSIFNELCAAGGKMYWYHPLRWDTWQLANNRTHRKLMIIDGETAFVGGAGIADHWMLPTRKGGPRWRDTVFSIDGDAVSGLLSTFSENWLETSGEILSSSKQFGFHPTPQGSPTLVVSSTPRSGGTTARILFQALIKSAKKSICITTPYFLPDHSARHALIEAAEKENISVRILVAGPHIDHPAVRQMSRHSSRHLLRAGAEIFEYQPSMIHAKLMVIDDAWCVFGSTNFDHRSFALNDEVNIATLDRELAASLQRTFEEDLRQSCRLTLKMVARGGLLDNAKLAMGAILEREV
ncbi:MAG: phosphatidylserine/phosphatidylglycerophosphate/cardiolipin synthase family protein [Acidobacteriaceae bacterium]